MIGFPVPPALEQKHYSSNDQINKYLDGTLESSQDSSTSAEGIKTVTILDYAEPLSPTREKGTFSISAADPCGDGSNQFATESGGVRWQTFPVTYGIDTTNSGVDPTAKKFCDTDLRRV